MWRISTHALTEGDGCIDRRRKVHEISTHALTEGDHLDVPWRPSDIISTHALTEGDELCDPMTAALGNFNSRPHGGRRYTLPTGRLASCISTHALTEGDRIARHCRL